MPRGERGDEKEATMMDWGNHMSAGGWIFSIIWTVIILAIVVAGIVWLVSALGNRNSVDSTSGTSAREILDRRLAKGELTIEQHKQLRDALGEGSSSARDPQPPRPAGAAG